MPPALTRAQAREHDRRCIEALGIPGVVLMENAARGCAELAMRMLPRARAGRVCVACGPGQNGGDGYAIARHLANAGHAVTIAFLGEPAVGGDAAVMRGVARAMGLPMRSIDAPDGLPGCDLVVDALFGTGLDRPLQGVALAAVRAVNATGAPVLSVDLPSGMDADTGAPIAWDRVTATTDCVVQRMWRTGEWLYVTGLFRGTVTAAVSTAFGVGLASTGMQDAFVVRMRVP